jgi:signal transduction histidine kinase
MCSAGMISLSAPVHVAGKTIAVLSTECRKPKPGAIWPSGIVGQDACSSDAIEPTKRTKVDIWQEAWVRIQECGKILGFKSEDFLKKVTESVKMEPRVEVSPEDLESLMIGLENASRHLSDLADKTYRLEKESVIGWLRAEMASALSSADDFWNRIRWCFENLAQLVGVDYIILLSRDKSQSGSLNLQSQYGLPQESIPALQYDWTGSKSLVDDFVGKINALEHIQEIDLKQYRDLPILSMLYDLYGRGVNYPVLIVPTTTMEGRLTFMVLGRKEPQTIVEDCDGLRSTGHSAQEWLQEDDQQYLMIIVRELAIITNVFYSMQRLQETVEAQTNLMESVAHDLRTPIQNIMIAAENLRECRVAPERASRTIAGVVTQLQRLNLLAQKAWMLERIRLDKMIYNDAQMVDPHLIFEECKEILTDMAERASIDIFIDPDVENWQAINVDAEMFRLMVLNLLHNAIKYSFPNVHIKVGGWQDNGGMGTTMTFENEGIAIHDEEKDRIFERYFRSKDAVKMEPAGSGIGLALVKEFVDHYKGVINVKSTEIGFGRYLNVFSLFLPER